MKNSLAVEKFCMPCQRVGKSLCRGIALLFLVPVFLIGQDKKQSTVPRLDPARFPERSRILIGKLPIMVTPRREYVLKAGTSGLIELYVPSKPGNFKAGDRLGGIDVARLKIDEELMELSESLLKEKEIPQWRLQRKTQIDQLMNQLNTIEGERKLAEQMIANPEKYNDLKNKL